MIINVPEQANSSWSERDERMKSGFFPCRLCGSYPDSKETRRRGRGYTVHEWIFMCSNRRCKNRHAFVEPSINPGFAKMVWNENNPPPEAT